MNEVKTLAEALPNEIKRCRKILPYYAEIGPAGRFGYMMISRDLAEAEKAILDGDVVGMLRSLHKLKEVK